MEWLVIASVVLFVVDMTRRLFKKLFEKKVYYVEDRPYLKLKWFGDRSVPEKLGKVVSEGPSVPADKDYLLEAVLTRKGVKVGEFAFFPEAPALLSPVDFMAKFAGVDRSKVKTITANRKLVISAGEYALVFNEAPRVIVTEEDPTAFLEGFGAGLMFRR